MKKFIGLFVVFVFLTGCSQLRNLGFKSYDNGFVNNLKKHTAEVTLYRDFTTIAIAKVTHFDKNLMKQYIEYVQKIDLDKNRDKRYVKMINEFDEYDIYWVAFYTEDDDINNLSDKDSFWNVYLLENSRTLSPVSVKEVELNNFKKQWMYLTNSNRWSRQYVVKFKKAPNKILHRSLVVSSFLGTMNFKFDN